jgi:hypothetical protein
LTTIAAAVYDAVVALGGLGCSIPEICTELSDHDRSMVVSAVHRLRENGVLRIQHDRVLGALYSVMPGAKRPEDGRGRPRKTPGDIEF